MPRAMAPSRANKAQSPIQTFDRPAPEEWIGIDVAELVELDVNVDDDVGVRVVVDDMRREPAR
jgi:hypothetical protein